MKRIAAMILSIICGIMMIGCSKEEEGAKMDLYYIDTDTNALVECDFRRTQTDVDESIKEVISALYTSPDMDLQSPIPKGVQIEGYRLQNRKLELIFNEEYLQMTKSAEILLRAAVVQTMVQVPEVSFVSFYIGNEPLKNSKDIPVGLMRAEDFVQNTGTKLKLVQKTDLNLYFPEKDGEAISLEKRKDVRYNMNTSIEKLVVEQLMKGPSSDKRSAIIPNTVKLLGVSAKDGICYVNFDSTFLNESYNQKPEITIYSIVNSIVTNGNVTKVQILVDGSSDVKFMGTFDLSEPLEWKADLVED